MSSPVNYPEFKQDLQEIYKAELRGDTNTAALIESLLT